MTIGRLRNPFIHRIQPVFGLAKPPTTASFKPMRLILAILIAGTGLVSAAEWNRLRGPNGSGVAANARPPVKLDPAQPTWKSPIRACRNLRNHGLGSLSRTLLCFSLWDTLRKPL